MRLIVAATALLALAACSPSAQPSLIAPTSGVCAGIPYIDPGAPPDTLPLTPDPTLEQKLPTQIDGQPTTDRSSGLLVETLCMLGGEASLAAAVQHAPVDLYAVTVASETATVDGRPVTITAYRYPGSYGDSIIPALGMLSEPNVNGPVAIDSRFETSIGGKPVETWTDAADGSTSYLYYSGDTLFIVDDVTESQAGKIFAALP